MIRPKKFATLKDVAVAAELSVATVSRYLNQSIRLPRDTTDRIDAAVRMLSYRPNPHARSLSLGRSGTIGFVVPDIANPFFARLAAAVEEAAVERGIGVVLCATLDRRERELEYLQRLSRNHVDGIIFIPSHGDDGELARAVDAASTVVLMDEDIDGTATAKIFSDNESGGFLATRHMIDAGHRRIAFAGSWTTLLSGRERLAGYRRALIESGIEPETALEFLGPYTADHGRAVAGTILSLREPPTAIFAASDEIVRGLLLELRESRIKVGRDLSLVAYDDVGPLELFDPAITAIRQPVDQMGRRGVDLVLGMIETGNRSSVVERVPVELIIRNSVAPPRRGA